MKKPVNCPQEFWDKVIWKNIRGVLAATIMAGPYTGWPWGVAWAYQQSVKDRNSRT